MAATYRADAFGNVVAATGSGAWGAAGYAHTRNVLDAGAGGLHDFHNRWCDPATGRFTQRRTPFQPLREHPYALAESNPATWTDRWGYCPTDSAKVRQLCEIACSGNAACMTDCESQVGTGSLTDQGISKILDRVAAGPPAGMNCHGFVCHVVGLPGASFEDPQMIQSSATPLVDPSGEMRSGDVLLVWPNPRGPFGALPGGDASHSAVFLFSSGGAWVVAEVNGISGRAPTTNGITSLPAGRYELPPHATTALPFRVR